MTVTNRRLSKQQLLDFRSRHQLPEAFEQTAENHYLPLARRLPELRPDHGPLRLGINGAQGTGKSTLADFLRVASAGLFDWNTAVLSIDDFYYTKAERTVLAKDIHPLLMTRGVPGTHDIVLLQKSLDTLQRLGPGEDMALPRFDKAIDDRASPSQWPVVSGPIDLIILEGWCVGSVSQAGAELVEPVNALERNEDSGGAWRCYANNQLDTRYRSIFEQLDVLIFLKAPSVDAIYRWRLQQEQELASKSPAGSPGLMDEREIRRFIQFYERLTRANLVTLPGKADVVFDLDEAHNVAGSQAKILT